MEHQPLTYQQLLAQQYEENARDLLVYQQTNYEDVEGGESTIEEHNAARDIGQTLEDPDGFRQFAGARNSDQVILKPQSFQDAGVTSVRRAKDVKNNIFNIDTRFRPYAAPGILPTPTSLIGNAAEYARIPIGNETSSSSHFVFNLDSQYKNIISAKLSSLQIPNKFFNLVDIRNNYYIYTKKGTYSSDFVLPFTDIAPNAKATYTVIKLLYPISSLVVGDIITISGTTNYDGSYDIKESTPTTISIVYQSYSETFAGPTYPTITVAPNASNTLAGFTRVGVYITSVNQNPRSTLTANLTEPIEGQTGFYYSNTSIFPALNTSYTTIFPDLKFTYLDGFCNIVNTSASQTYTINLTPEGTGIYPAYFPTLGAMLGFYNYLYEINPASTNTTGPCNISCAQISYCSVYGSLMSENKVDMNADAYIQLAIQSWENVIQQDGADSYYGVFQKIPINVQKGDIIYDFLYNNSVTKKYDFLQPTNVRYLEIYLYDRLGYPLLMPGVDWSMVLELEEVLNSALYDKMREI